jgi:hypothetical protein
MKFEVLVEFIPPEAEGIVDTRGLDDEKKIF